MDFNPSKMKIGDKFIVSHKDGRKFYMTYDHVIEKKNAMGENVPGHVIQYVFRIDQIGNKKGQVWNGYFRAAYDLRIAKQQFEHLFNDIQKVE